MPVGLFGIHDGEELRLRAHARAQLVEVERPAVLAPQLHDVDGAAEVLGDAAHLPIARLHDRHAVARLEERLADERVRLRRSDGHEDLVLRRRWRIRLRDALPEERRPVHLGIEELELCQLLQLARVEEQPERRAADGAVGEVQFDLVLVERLPALHLERPEGCRRGAHSSSLRPSPAPAARRITSAATAASCTPMPQRSAIVICSAAVRPATSPATSAPSDRI